MIEWEDDAVILRVTPHGENSAVAILLTHEHGKHAGFVRSANSRGTRGFLELGNRVRVTWKARLLEHLGNYKIDLVKSVASNFFDDPLKMMGLTAVVSIAEEALPDREPAPEIYHGLLALMSTMLTEDVEVWLAAYIRWEIGFLSESGFSLDLERCAVTGTNENLVFVSPKSGRAVSASVGNKYRTRLLALPGFLTQKGFKGRKEFTDGLKLTEYFLSKHIFGSYNKPIPKARERFFEFVEKSL
tara:strand:+ start:60 stop:791 length:732 start_codon:yes stop_codon:yes gene_type:complete